jgi:hypothetical protein
VEGIAQGDPPVDMLQHGTAQQFRQWFSWKARRAHARRYYSNCFHLWIIEEHQLRGIATDSNALREDWLRDSLLQADILPSDRECL